MKPNRIYIVRKYVVATGSKDAIKKERSTPVHDVYLDENSQKQMVEELNKTNNKIGFLK